MARFDVFANPTAGERKHTPYFIDVQNDFIDALGTRVVIPLRREASFGLRSRNLNPAFSVGVDTVVLDTAALGTVPLLVLRKPVMNLAASRAEIQEALETLFGSF